MYFHCPNMNIDIGTNCEVCKEIIIVAGLKCLNRARADIRQLSQENKVGSRKIKLAQTYERYDFPNITRTLRGSQIFFQYKCVWKCQTIAVYTMQAVKIVLPVYFLAKFDTS